MLIVLAPITILSSLLCLLYCIKPKKNTSYAKIRKIILYDSFAKIGNIISSTIGPKPIQLIRSFKHYVVNTNNPITQIFYILLFPGAYTGFIFCLLIPYNHIYSIWDHIIGHSSVLISFFLYYKTCTVDPGIITKSNAYKYKKKYAAYAEGGLFRSENCATCVTPKPARSKHCKICDVCVSKLDHHCIWIRGCVGEHNYKYFLGFISSHSLMCFVGSIISLKCLNSIVDDMGLWGLQFKSSSGKILDASFWVIFRFLFDNFEVPMFLFILCTILAFALLGFFLYHINLMKKGVSMSEAAKLADFTDKLRRTKIDFERRVERYKQLFPNHEKDRNEREKMKREMKKKFDKEWKEFQRELDIIIRNYNSKTFFENLGEVLTA